MTSCAICGWRPQYSIPHNILDKFHLVKIAQNHDPTTAAQIIEGNYKQVAGEWP